MKLGLSLTQLAAEIERRAEAKKDFIAPVGKMELATVKTAEATETKPATFAPVLALNNGSSTQFPLTSVAHAQLAEFAGIPKPYYDKMAEQDPGLLATNVNRWFRDKGKERRMVRTLDGKARALLSDKYRALENEELAEAILPILLDRGLIILSAQITESRMYIKAVDKTILKDIPTGKKLGAGHDHFDTISPGVIIGNSEVGHGSLFVDRVVYTGGCTNLMISYRSLRKYHTGARSELSDDVYALLSDGTKKLTDAAVWAQARDVVTGALNPADFEKTAAKLIDATHDPIGDDVVEVVKKVGVRFQLNEGERKGILARLIEGADLTRYGLHAAVTRHSADVEDYDRATELERIGGNIIELPATDWAVMSDIRKAA